MFCLFVSGLILTPKVDQRFMKSKCSQDQISLTSFFMIGEVVFFSNNQAPDTHFDTCLCDVCFSQVALVHMKDSS